MVSDKNSPSPRESRSRSRSADHSDRAKSHSPKPDEEGNKLNESNGSESKAELKKSDSIEKLDDRVRSKSRSSSGSRSRSRSRRRHSDRRDTRRHKRRSSRSRSASKSPRGRSRSRSRGYRHRRRDSRERPSRRRHSRSYSRSRSPSPYYRRLNPSPCRVIGIFGLNFQTDDRDLKRIFEKYGRLDKVKLVTDPRTGRSRGFAFVYFQQVEDAEEAKDRIHGSEIDGNHVRCEFSISNREHNPTPGIYMGRRTATSRYDDRDDYHRRGGYGSRSRSRSRSYERRRRSYSNDRY